MSWTGIHDVYRYRRRWFELRGDVRGKTLVIAEYEGAQAFERAKNAMKRLTRYGYLNLHVVNCFLSETQKLEGTSDGN